MVAKLNRPVTKPIKYSSTKKLETCSKLSLKTVEYCVTFTQSYQ